MLSIAILGNYSWMRGNSPLNLPAVNKLLVHAFGSNAIATFVAMMQGHLHCGLSPVKSKKDAAVKKNKTQVCSPQGEASHQPLLKACNKQSIWAKS